MRELKTIEVDRYESMPNEQFAKHIGMKTGKEVFNQLETHLKSVGLLPDEYFHPFPLLDLEKELPEFSEAVCHTNWGSSEGIYIDIFFLVPKDGQNVQIPFATGKTLAESGDAFLHMSRIASECSIMLNGRGSVVRVSEQTYPDLDNSRSPADHTVDIYQLRYGDPSAEKLLFRNSDSLARLNIPIDKKNYDLVYSGPMFLGETLEDLYTRFNINHPEDFKGHSLSVSDVITIHNNNISKTYFTDSFGFKELPDFHKGPRSFSGLDEKIRSAAVKSTGQTPSTMSVPER